MPTPPKDERVEPAKPAEGSRPAGALLIAHLRGKGDVALSSDEIMALTRGD